MADEPRGAWAVEVLDEKQEPHNPRRWFTSYTRYSGICFTADPKHAKTFATPDAALDTIDAIGGDGRPEIPDEKRRLLAITHAPKVEEKR